MSRPQRVIHTYFHKILIVYTKFRHVLKGLTSAIKKSIIKIEGSGPFWRKPLHPARSSLHRRIRGTNTLKEVEIMKIATIAGLVLAFTLAACGGGGGGGTTTPPPPPPPTDTTKPTFTFVSSTASSVVVKASEAVMTSGASISLVDGGAVKSGSTTLGTDQMTMTWTSTSGDLACGKTYTVAATATDLAGNASAPPATPMTLTTTACPTSYWNPVPTFTAMGTKVSGANQLPAGCTAETMQCWKDAVTNGTVKLVATTATMTGSNSRPIVFAYYKTAAGLWNFIPMYADTGTLVGGTINDGVSSEADWTSGFSQGLYIHEKSSGQCFAKTWFGPNDPSGNSNVWATNPATCPNVQ
jgi:hypothetical protein